MHHIINYLENQGFIRTQNIESLKITLKEEGDLRYFWDENSLGLHIKKDFWDGDPLFYQKMGLTLLKEVAPKLKILYLARNGFMDLEINNYPNLEYLNVSENKRITSLSLQNMPKLEELNVSFCEQLTSLSLEGDFKFLEKIDVSFGALTALKLPAALPNLAFFNFRNNQLAESGFLKFLLKDSNLDVSEMLFWQDNPVADELRAALEAQDLDLIKKFLGGKRIMVARNKLILLGNTQAGKTSLCHILEPNIKADGESTHGVNVFDYQLDKIHYQVYDFGGQDFYHNTHLAFFGEKAKYLMVYGNGQANDYGQIDAFESVEDRIDGKVARQDDVFPMNYWLDSVAVHLKPQKQLEEDEKLDQGQSRKSTFDQHQISLALWQNTRKDEPSKRLNQQDLEEQFGVNDFLEGTLKAEEGKNIDPEIKTKVDDWLKNQSKKVEILADTLKWEEYFQQNKNWVVVPKKVFTKVFTIDPNQYSQALDDDVFTFLNAAFVIYQCRKSDKSVLQENVIVNLGEFTKWIYDILTKEMLGDGYFERGEAEKRLSEEAKPHLDFILAFLLEHEMIFEIANTDQSKNYLVPQYRPVPSYPADKLLLQLFDKPFLQYEFEGFYHTQILTVIIARYFNNVAKEDVNNKWKHLIWKNKVILQLLANEDQALKGLLLITFEFPAQGSKTKPMLLLSEMKPNSLPFEELKDVIAFIDQELKNKNIVHQKNVRTPNQTYISASLLQLENRDTKGQISDLIYDPNTKFFYRQGDFPLFTDPKKYPMKKLFISYSKDDDNYKKEFKEHLISLQRENLVDTFDDRGLELGEKWDAKLRQKIVECDYFICLISVKFLNVGYVQNIELPDAIRHNKKLIPIIIKPCDWINFPITWTDEKGNKTTEKLGDYNAHNKGSMIALNPNFITNDGKSVIRAYSEEERDYKWLEVITALRNRIKPT